MKNREEARILRCNSFLAKESLYLMIQVRPIHTFKFPIDLQYINTRSFTTNLFVLHQQSFDW